MWEQNLCHPRDLVPWIKGACTQVLGINRLPRNQQTSMWYWQSSTTKGKQRSWTETTAMPFFQEEKSDTFSSWLLFFFSFICLFCLPYWLIKLFLYIALQLLMIARGICWFALRTTATFISGLRSTSSNSRSPSVEIWLGYTNTSYRRTYALSWKRQPICVL